jgi:AcrR family transcriptional regulator
MSPTPTESPSTPGRRERRRLEIRERLVEASRALFETKGYEDTTIAEICDRADVAYGTFFNHFPAKVDLLRVLVDRAVDSVLVGLETLAKQPGSITDHLVWLFEGAAQSFQGLSHQEHELLGRIQALAFLHGPEENDRRFRAGFESYLRSHVEAGRVRSDVPVETLAEVVGSTFASMSLSWVHFPDTPIRERAAAAARFLAASIAAPEPPAEGEK